MKQRANSKRVYENDKIQIIARVKANQRRNQEIEQIEHLYEMKEQGLISFENLTLKDNHELHNNLEILGIDWMHGTARAPGYPSDSTRSLAGVGPLDVLPGDVRTTIAHGQRGRRSVTYAPWAPLAVWAGAGRARMPAETRSLAGAGPLDESPWAVRTTFARGQRGGGIRHARTVGIVGRAGRSRAGPQARRQSRSSRRCPRPSTPFSAPPPVGRGRLA